MWGPKEGWGHRVEDEEEGVRFMCGVWNMMFKCVHHYL